MDVASHGSARLLMVRKAGASFTSDLNIRSPVFEVVLEEFAAAGMELERLREQLVDQLHTVVPQTGDRTNRNLLLKAKRAVFNRRPIASLEAVSLEPTLQKDLARYSVLLARRTELLDSARYEVFAELRSQLRRLTLNKEFRTAVDYSCPWLLGKYERAEEEGELSFSNAERAIYAYATKFFSKANPFHLFATVAFPSTGNDAPESYCELIINTTLLLNLERALLKTVSDPYRRRAYLRAFLYEDNTFRFINVKNLGLRLISAKDNPLLRQVIAFFNDLNREPTIGNCLDFVLEALSISEKKMVQDYLETLIKQGVVVEYLVRDFDNFKDDLFGLSAEYDELISNLQDLHLACIARAELPEIHDKLGSLALDQTVATENLYYVNTYERTEAGPHESLLHAVENDLRDLKPLFPVSNFFERAYIIKSFLLDRVRAAPGREVSYLELMCEFLRHFSETIESYQASVHRQRDEQQAIVNWLRQVSNCSGHLKPGEFAALLADRPPALLDQTAQGTDSNQTLCFNGSCDYVKGIYYLANVFAGNGRYASRYLLHQRTRRYQQMPSDAEWLDVQLVAPFKDNRSYIVAMLPTGCGFETRYRHYFEDWIDAANIVVGERAGRVVYRDGASGRLLRFHFFGFVLAEFLTAEYQLLLAEHGDMYLNLFEQNPVMIGASESLVIPPLYYGSVCLRREQWAFSKSVLDNVCGNDDILTCTAKLREWLHHTISTEDNEMYFRSWSPRDGSSPRFIDLRNPLSVQTFQRALSGLPHDSMISFARMEPPPAHLYLQDDGPFLTELMIEV